MLKSVKAEFDGFDSAEAASRKIRKNVKFCPFKGTSI